MKRRWEGAFQLHDTASVRSGFRQSGNREPVEIIKQGVTNFNLLFQWAVIGYVYQQRTLPPAFTYTIITCFETWQKYYPLSKKKKHTLILCRKKFSKRLKKFNERVRTYPDLDKTRTVCGFQFENMWQMRLLWDS